VHRTPSESREEGFFGPSRPERHRYLGVEVVWEQVPGTHSSYGDMSWGFHVKTR
jgi:hypothetical protein